MDEEDRAGACPDRVNGFRLEALPVQDALRTVDVYVLAGLHPGEVGAGIRHEGPVLPVDALENVDGGLNEVARHGAVSAFVGVLGKLFLEGRLPPVEESQRRRGRLPVDEGYGHLETVAEGDPLVGPAAPVLKHEDDGRVPPKEVLIAH